ncbi:hypothetical protein J5N97_022126 [Dioscorea zingiberensis]|uniref:Uncharacterized protein n=1 Tax=Dioscorea zingiberensis TaxID=325984 RepID=A0A9D5CAD5_9LILI|nr:hypothetical protein J5N97_022126 [Dioscorea zingiberensis]
MTDEIATSREIEEDQLRHGKEEVVGTSSSQEVADHGDKNWLQLSIGGGSTSSTSSQPPRRSAPSSMMISMSSQVLDHLPSGSSGVLAAHVRVVSPPPRSPAGLWFTLKAAQNQRRETLLPQIPKSYLRIRDGSMTVRLLMKYLVFKLGLEHESEVQITCRSQELLPILTLQQVRDYIWYPNLQDSSSIYHVMTLQYSRRM